MAISKDKTRYSISLPTAMVTRFQTLAREVGLPQATLSNVCTDSLKVFIEMFQYAKEGGSLSIEDLRKLTGEQLDLLSQEEIEDTNHGNKKRKEKASS